MKKALCITAMALLVSGVAPALAEGWLYTDSTVPVDTEVQTQNSSKCGTAKCYNVLNLVEWGDCGLQAAMKKRKNQTSSSP